MALRFDAAQTVRVSKTNGTECPNDFCEVEVCCLRVNTIYA